MVDPLASDDQIRLAAVGQVRQASSGGVLTSEALGAGFVVNGRRLPLTNPQRGIFKPREMRYLLSVKTVFPNRGRKVWYDDQRLVHEQIDRGEELIDYAFMGNDPNAHDNRWLLEAHEAQVPIFYFLGIAPQRYLPLWPTYIAAWLPYESKVQLAFGMSAQLSPQRLLPPAIERRYALRSVRQRLHQASFREAVLAAYDNRCAITGLPEPRLLDAAHIIADGHEELGIPIISNGLPLSKVHHAAFDANLIGISPELRVHVSEQLLRLNDGPMFEQGVKAIRGKQIRLPARGIDAPDRERLAIRFAEFLAAC